jgi:Ni/Co efflux regulator RcnB
MQSKAIVSAVMAVALTTGSASFGQGREGRGGSDGPQRGEQRDFRNDDARAPDRGRNRGQARKYERRDEGRGERGAGPDHSYYRGQRLPAEYRSRQYVVEDWRGHHLSAPPRGYHWVQSGADYVLVAIATGVILQLLLNH